MFFSPPRNPGNAENDAQMAEQGSENNPGEGNQNYRRRRQNRPKRPRPAEDAEAKPADAAPAVANVRLAFFSTLNQKSNLQYTCGITPKRVTRSIAA